VSRARNRSILWLLVRLGVCVGALGYVLAQTEWYDTAWLKDSDVPVRLVRAEGDSAEIIADGQRRTVPLDRLGRNPDGSLRLRFGLRSLWGRSHKGLLLIGLALYGLQPTLQVIRFKWMLRLQQVPVRWRDAAALCWVGNFYSFVIPGTTGGDVVRAAYLVRNTSALHRAVVAIGLDRLTGLAGLLALATLVGFGLPAPQPVVRRAAWLSLGMLAAMIAGFFLATGYEGVGRWLSRLPFARHLERFHAALSAAKDRWKILAAAAALTIVLQSGTLSAFSVAAIALGMEPIWQQYFVCLPIALVVAAVPVVPMGLGTLEATMVLLLAGRAGTVSQVLALAVAMRVMGLLWALPGGLLPLVWSGVPQRGSQG